MRSTHTPQRTIMRGWVICSFMTAYLLWAFMPASEAEVLYLQENGCPVRESVDPSASPLIIISDGPVPGPKKMRRVPTPSQTKCVELLRSVGRKAIEKKKVTEGVSRYLAAITVAPALAQTTYLDLANALDRYAYSEPALAAYFKAWQAYEVDYNRPDAKLDGVAVLALADIRDSIVRLGGQVPKPTSEVGRIVVSNSSRNLREQYFNADPLTQSTPNK